MKTLSAAALVALSLAAMPALAFNGAVDLPNLTFPEPASGPATQGCITPSQPGPAACPATR